MAKRPDEGPVAPAVEPRGGAEALRPYIGKVVAFEPGGEIRASADTWEQLLKQLTEDMLDKLCLLYVPAGSVVGVT